MIRDTYAELIMESILREILNEGTAPTAAEITTRFDDFVAAYDISQPLFIGEDYSVEPGEVSSIAQYNGANAAILQDLKVLYRHLFSTTNQSIKGFERWKKEAEVLEERLQELEERITNLLLVADDTEGYFNFMYDNFATTSKVDLTNTTAYVNVGKSLVTIGTSTSGGTRLDLSGLDPNKDIEFSVLSRNNLASVQQASKSELKNAVSDKANFWQNRVITTSATPVSIELKVKLPAKKTVSRIDIDLHSANANSAVQITPMYSVDNYNYNQLPTTNFTRSVVKKGAFQFTPVQASQIKFIMTKTGADQVVGNQYAYEFGVDDISFYNEQFTATTSQDTGAVFISKPLSVVDTASQPEQFSKVTLKVCEEVPTGTSIDYYLTASNDLTVPISSGIWTAISPNNRSNPTNPTVIDFGDLDETTVSGVKVSYDATETDLRFVNPDKDFTIVESVAAGVATETAAIASDQRYSFLNSDDYILDHCIASGIQIAKKTLEVWRNVAVVATTDKVRGEIVGWGYSDPYYSTTVYVSNAVGTDIDWGGKAVLIDGIARTGTFTVSQGAHKIQVHKDNWKEVLQTSVNSLTALKAADSLYPYNHRYLVEGFGYPALYPSTDEKVYHGFDIMAEYLMKEVSAFDLINNVADSDYAKFAIDKDMPDAAGLVGGTITAKEAMSVILLKVDTGSSDFINERFIVKFKSANTLYKYLRLKAVLKTTKSTITPAIDSYQIKIAS